jgi:hypothetical protein
VLGAGRTIVTFIELRQEHIVWDTFGDHRWRCSDDPVAADDVVVEEGERFAGFHRFDPHGDFVPEKDGSESALEAIRLTASRMMAPSAKLAQASVRRLMRPAAAAARPSVLVVFCVFAAMVGDSLTRPCADR